MKLTHKQKVKMARKMRTLWELKKRSGRVSIFQTRAWEKRKKAIQERIKKRYAKV